MTADGGRGQLWYGRLVVEILGPDGHHGVIGRMQLGLLPLLLLHKLLVDVDLKGQLVLQLSQLNVGPPPLGFELSQLRFGSSLTGSLGVLKVRLPPKRSSAMVDKIDYHFRPVSFSF